MKDVTELLAKHLQRLDTSFSKDWIAEFSNFMEFVQTNPFTIQILDSIKEQKEAAYASLIQSLEELLKEGARCLIEIQKRMVRKHITEDDFCPFEFGEWSPDCKGSFLEGYASVRKVPNYKPMMPLLRLSRAIAAVGFTVKRGTWKSRNSKLYQFNLSYLESL